MNQIIYNKTTADPDHPDLAGLLVKNKNLLAELRNLQNKLLIKESSLQDMKNELESYKEDNSKQSFQIISLKSDIKELEDLIASLTRDKSLKSINNQTLKRGNLDLNERIIELENRLRVHLVERERAEQKADLLEKKLAGANGFTPYMNVKGQEDTLGSFMIKGEGCKQEIQMLNKRLEQLQHHQEELSQTEKKCREQKRPLKRLEGKIAVNDCFQARLDLGRNKENSRTKNCRIDENSKRFKQPEKDNKQKTLLSIKQNLQIATTQRLEEEIQQLQKKLSELKLLNKNMKAQLTRVTVLKDKTIQKLRQSSIKVEAIKGKAAMKTDNLKTTLVPTKQEARWDKDGTHHMLHAGTPELCTAKSTLEEVSGRPQEEVNFRETIMKMLGFNMKTADKEIITHLRLIIQTYEASNKSKIASDGETGQKKA
ncbi:unnamed protein product [Pipistrellus nathusii]|uniref:Coiled-coil domain-containing protein 170-like n=1 Tax=Pipistrellus nathusii TaxID=59473 RepID=A0ABN9Z198_PIPNA